MVIEFHTGTHNNRRKGLQDSGALFPVDEVPQ